MNDFFYAFYTMDITIAAIVMLMLFSAWTVIGAVFRRRMRVIGAVMAAASLALIVYMTMFSRDNAEVGVYIVPFSALARMAEIPTLYREMVMNVFLFLPLGMALPFVFSGGTLKRILLTVLVSLLLSAAVEAIQYFLAIGMTETDDVLCNTLGAAVGSCSYLLSFWLRKAADKRKASR